MCEALGLMYKELVISTRKGRGLVATKNIKKESVILQEKPLVSAQFLWNKRCGYAACDHCMSALETACDNLRRLTKDPQLSLPHKDLDAVDPSSQVECPHCSLRYCSAACRDQGWRRYHQLLCLGPSAQDEIHPSNMLDEIWRNSHFPPETASVHLVTRIIAMIRIDPDFRASMKKFCFDSKNKDGRLIHKVFGDKFDSRREEIRNALLSFLDFGEAAEYLSESGFASLLTLIGMNSQGIGTNSFTSWYRNLESSPLPDDDKLSVEAFVDQVYEKIEAETGTDFMNNEGAALYRLQSACNHSCDPNAEVTFPNNNDTLVLVATRDIEAGEEICISYLEECQRDRSRHSRRKQLMENYVFECECDKCEAQTNEDDVTSDEEEEEDSEDEMES